MTFLVFVNHVDVDHVRRIRRKRNNLVPDPLRTVILTNPYIDIMKTLDR